MPSVSLLRRFIPKHQMHINEAFAIAANVKISGKVLVISLALPIAEIRVVPTGRE